jgi:hypothetical protein
MWYRPAGLPRELGRLAGPGEQEDGGDRERRAEPEGDDAARAVGRQRVRGGIPNSSRTSSSWRSAIAR